MLTIEEIQKIIKMIDDSSIHEFIYELNGEKIVLKKGQTPVNVESIPTRPILTEQQAIMDTAKEIAIAKEEEQFTSKEPSTNVDYDYEITSPMVGTVYHAPSPDSDPYVTVGSQVTKDSVVCIVEAMKLFNEIEAEIDGTIVEILVENGELVEYGQPLFRVKTR